MMAMMHVAIHDALNAIDRRYQPYAFDGHAPDGLAEDKVEALLGEDGGSNGRVSDGSARLVELENRLAQVRERSMTEQEALGRVIDPEPVIGQAVRRELRAEVERVHRELLERFAGQMQTLASINRQLLELRPLHGESLLASGTNFLGHLHSSLTTE